MRSSSASTHCTRNRRTTGRRAERRSPPSLRASTTGRSADATRTRFNAAREHFSDISYEWVTSSGRPMSLMAAVLRPATVFATVAPLAVLFVWQGWTQLSATLPFFLVALGLPEGMVTFINLMQHAYESRMAAQDTAELLSQAPMPEGGFDADDGPAPESRPGRGRTVVQTLLLGAVLFGFRIHLELAFSAHYDQLTLSGAAGYFRAHNGLVNFPFIAGLAAGFVVGAMIAGGRTNTWLAWLIAATGVGIASVPLLPFDIAVLTGAVLASAGLGIGLSGQLVALLRLAAGNRISRAAALFQVAQNLGYGVGIGVPMALILALGDTVTPDARVHLFLGCSLILLVTGLVLALRKPKNRVAAQRDSEEQTKRRIQSPRPGKPVTTSAKQK